MSTATFRVNLPSRHPPKRRKPVYCFINSETATYNEDDQVRNIRRYAQINRLSRRPVEGVHLLYEDNGGSRTASRLTLPINALVEEQPEQQNEAGAEDHRPPRRSLAVTCVGAQAQSSDADDRRPPKRRSLHKITTQRQQRALADQSPDIYSVSPTHRWTVLDLEFDDPFNASPIRAPKQDFLVRFYVEAASVAYEFRDIGTQVSRELRHHRRIKWVPDGLASEAAYAAMLAYSSSAPQLRMPVSTVRFYVTLAIKAINRAINDANLQHADATLSAVVLLAIVAQRMDDMHACLAHFDGLAALVASRRSAGVPMLDTYKRSGKPPDWITVGGSIQNHCPPREGAIPTTTPAAPILERMSHYSVTIGHGFDDLITRGLIRHTHSSYLRYHLAMISHPGSSVFQADGLACPTYAQHAYVDGNHLVTSEPSSVQAAAQLHKHRIEQGSSHCHSTRSMPAPLSSDETSMQLVQTKESPMETLVNRCAHMCLHVFMTSGSAHACHVASIGAASIRKSVQVVGSRFLVNMYPLLAIWVAFVAGDARIAPTDRIWLCALLRASVRAIREADGEGSTEHLTFERIAEECRALWLWDDVFEASCRRQWHGAGPCDEFDSAADWSILESMREDDGLDVEREIFPFVPSLWQSDTLVRKSVPLL
ncbi:hypothetical protein MRB53_037562 [Persea americana]|nr:hypothetical protein MRB53_037562 [Persea americana]